MFDLKYVFDFLQKALQRMGVVVVSQGRIIAYYRSSMDTEKLNRLIYDLKDLAIDFDGDSTFGFTSYDDGYFPDFDVILYEVQDLDFDY